MKRIIQLSIVLLLTLRAAAQAFTPPAFAEIDNNYRNYENQVFGALESNGFLHE